jgi:hypothetical protein
MEKADISLSPKRRKEKLSTQILLVSFDSETLDGYTISFQPSIRPFAELKYTPIIWTFPQING